MLFYSFFKTLVGKEIVVELKNGAGAPVPLAVRARARERALLTATRARRQI